MADDQVVGAALPEEQVAASSQLAGLGEGTVVTVHNPLPQDFRVQYARSVIQPFAEKESEKFAREKANLEIGKDQGQTNAHAVQYLVLKAGQSMNLPGDIAQIAVRQLVTYMIGADHQGQATKPIADPYQRAEYEKRIVLSVKNAADFMNTINQTPQEKTDKQLEDLNPPKEEDKVPDPAPGTGTNY